MKLSMFQHEKTRNMALQVAFFLAFLALASFLLVNLFTNLERQNIATGFGFLNETAGFPAIQSLIPFDESSSYARAFLVGLLNTLLVSVLGIILASIIGLIAGLARLSDNFLVAGLGTGFLETIRNIPLLLQLFFWYFAVLQTLPHPRKSWSLFDAAFLNKRGLYLPELMLPGWYWLILCAVLLLLYWIWICKTGLMRKTLPVVIVALLVLMFANSGLGFPELKGFNFKGGIEVVPEFIALWLALSVYTGAYIGEIIRGGIQAVPKGQTESAKALGLQKSDILYQVTLPQALRVIIPPLTNQYLNLMKNSSLAVAIGYPDLTSVFAGTALNQTGQAVEIILMTMAVYLFLSLVISLGMNLVNRQTQFEGR